MHNVITRTITAGILLILGLSIYAFTPPFIITGLLILLLLYILWFEYRPLYRPMYYASYISFILIVSGFGVLIFLNHYMHAFLIIPIFFAMIADTSAYIVGNLFGTHRIAPTISPKKTWEGFIGSCICVTIGLMIWGYFSHTIEIWNTKNILGFLLIGFGCATAGLLGDLCISQLKRNAGVKDTGTLLPGHGGLLDRLDSVLAIALLAIALYFYFFYR